MRGVLPKPPGGGRRRGGKKGIGSFSEWHTWKRGEWNTAYSIKKEQKMVSPGGGGKKKSDRMFLGFKKPNVAFIWERSPLPSHEEKRENVLLSRDREGES